MSANPPTTVLQGDVAAPPHQFQHPTPFIKSPYNYDPKAESDRTAIAPGGPSLTVQSMAEEADLNVLMTRMGLLNKMPSTVRLPEYADFSHITDFQSAMNAILDAEDSFSELPANVRAQFENSPQKLLDFVANPANVEQVKTIFGEKNVEREPRVSGGAMPAESASSGAKAAGAGQAARVDSAGDK